MAVWELGRGWTFDTDIFVENSVKGVGAVLAVAAPVTSVGRAILVGGAKVATRAAPIIASTATRVASRAKVVTGKVSKAATAVIARTAKGVKKLANPTTIAAGIDFIKNATPTLVDRVVVTVKGQPGANKKTLYYLALSAGFGVIRRFDFGLKGVYAAAPPGNIQIRYDLTQNWVEVVIEYTTSLLAAAATQSYSGSIAASVTNIALTPFLGPFTSTLTTGIEAQIAEWAGETPAPMGFYKEAVIYSGPKEGLIGGDWGFTGLTTPLVPSTAKSPGAPNLPFSGQAILTTQRANNPRPPGDNRSRGTLPLIDPASHDDGLDTSLSSKLVRHLIPLVFASLSNPGSFIAETFVPPSTVVGEG